MTRIRATCPDCGEIELRPADVVLRRVLDEFGDVSDGSCYRFSCPDCDELVEKPADERIVSLLSTGGVPIEDVGPQIDTRPDHPERAVGGPPLTPDDLLDLHLMLHHDPDWFEALLATTGR